MLNRLFRNAAGARAFEALEPRCLLAADLFIQEGGLTTFRDADQNMVIKLPVTVFNRGGGIYGGGGQIEYYLSTDRTFDGGDHLFATTPLPRRFARVAK